LAVVYSREIDGNIITLTPSGWTYGIDAFVSTFVLMDKETESLWFPAGEQGCALPLKPLSESGCGLVGISDGEFLSRTTWAEWKSAHPDTKYVTD
jgi:hypothetical protein